MTDNITKFYENTSKRFWSPIDGPIGRDLEIIKLFKNLNLSGSFLDYGFGSGSLLFYLAKDMNVSKIIGADISKKNINKAQENLEIYNSDYPGVLEKVSFVIPRNDLMSDIDDNSIDNVICVATLEHVMDPYILLDELFRITKKGGTLICSVPNYAYIRHRIDLLFGKLPITGTNVPVKDWRKVGWDGMHLHTFTQNAFEILLKDCGWKVNKVLGYRKKMKFLSPLTKNFPSFWSGELVACLEK